MIFALTVLLSAFLIESIGTYVSVVGLSSLFAANPVIITLAIALDVGKVVTVSFLYKHWNRIGIVMKGYMTSAAVILMLITSAGAFGYLSAEFQKAIQGTSENTVLVTAMEDERGRLQARKEEIDKQIADIPSTFISGRRQIINSFKSEVDRINARLVEIDTQLPPLKLDTIKKNVEVGPIIYIAEAFNTTPAQAVKWVILVIIFVFDPLAIALLLAGNFLISELSRRKTLAPVPSDVFVEKVVEPVEKLSEVPSANSPLVTGAVSELAANTAPVDPLHSGENALKSATALGDHYQDTIIDVSALPAHAAGDIVIQQLDNLGVHTEAEPVTAVNNAEASSTEAVSSDTESNLELPAGEPPVIVSPTSADDGERPNETDETAEAPAEADHYSLPRTALDGEFGIGFTTMPQFRRAEENIAPAAPARSSLEAMIDPADIEDEDNRPASNILGMYRDN